MKTLKICVYAICKNEAQFVTRWMDSMSEADGVYVLDTGSTDETVRLLKSRGAHVKTRAISPWRFDTARNLSLKTVPPDADVCVCTDLDEQFEPGWRQKLEAAWQPGAHRMRYRYTWSFLPDGSEGVVFWIDKIHSRGDFVWTHPVHEVLKFTGEGDCVTVTGVGIQLNHHPDPNKPRSQYLPLLEQSVREDPGDDRNMHYLGREYMYYGMWEKCIETLKRHLALPSAKWADERCASMRYIAKACARLNDTAEAEKWHLKSIAEAPYLREPYLDAAMFYYGRSDWEGVLYCTSHALSITSRSMSYINEPECWGALPYDLGALALYYLGVYDRALTYADKALSFRPSDERLLANRRLIAQKVNGSL